MCPRSSLRGDDGQIVPIDAAGRLSARIVRQATLKARPGASHDMCAVNARQVDAELLAFLSA